MHYWEVIAHDSTMNEPKVGVTCDNSFNFQTAFCDHNFGFAYYGIGQLRHGSNAQGPAYGEKFKNDGVLGVFLDMGKGTLSFSFNGVSYGVAFENEMLKQGPIYPAISLLHKAKFTLRAGLPIPAMFIS
eukprot:TRINITY_DN8699_c0_g1_i2.p2 TRINITY_DN8699_c0_g1~~TRINITY_DN8699_c0_g1_i2.p2  ORF type:complete len:129 (-),score=19.97 TRINITY_DN8699_c0_g1_i2:188-574(-)